MSSTAKLSKKQAPASSNAPLIHGDDVEIAKVMASAAGSAMVHSEGQFWLWEKTQWQPVPIEELRRQVQLFSGWPVANKGEVRLSRSRIESIIWNLSVLKEQPEWFAAAPAGINCASGFIKFDASGKPDLLLHSPDHRQRHTLPGHWQPGAPSLPPRGSLLEKLLTGCFVDDLDAADKVDLVAEICGCAALGHSTRLKAPKAIIMHGVGAENGKSQLGNMVRSLLPADACCAIAPAELGDDTKLVMLVGKLLNERNEISGAKAIASETFKAAITGEMITARNVYEAAISFRPVALHVYACNKPPRFDDGIDRGVRRRLLPLVFNRTIPKEEQIEDIGIRIGQEEADALLAFAVAGASRLLAASAYTTPASSIEALGQWIAGDVVAEWASAAIEVVGIADASMPTKDAYSAFRGWAMLEGYSERFLPSRYNFPNRLTSVDPRIVYGTLHGRGIFKGLRLAGSRNGQDGGGVQ